MLRKIFCLGSIVLGLSVCGCGDSKPAKVIVTGRVTYDGQEIVNGEIRFYPMAGTSGPVSGAPIKDGVYTAENKGGVPLGQHKVQILAFRAPRSNSKKVAGVRGEGGIRQQYLPDKYNKATDLQVVISNDGGTVTRNFDLLK